jgi:hypothetical protein
MLVKRIEIEKEQVRLVYKMDIRPFERGPERGFSKDCTLRRGVAQWAKSKKNFCEIQWKLNRGVARLHKKSRRRRNTGEGMRSEWKTEDSRECEYGLSA